jgi:hypothetical protein
MTPEEKTQLEDLKKQVSELKASVNYGNFQDKKVFDKTALFNNGIKFPNNAFIYGGSATTNASIKLDVGTPPGGSIYISTNGVGEIWVMQSTTWTKLTIN